MICGSKRSQIYIKKVEQIKKKNMENSSYLVPDFGAVSKKGLDIHLKNLKKKKVLNHGRIL